MTSRTYRSVISKLAAKAGATKSPAKAAAARRNGRLAKAGGRPVLDIPAEVLAEIRRQFPGREGRYQREKERRKWRAIEKLKAERLRIARRLRLTNFTDETALAHALAHALRES